MSFQPFTEHTVVENLNVPIDTNIANINQMDIENLDDTNANKVIY